MKLCGVLLLVVCVYSSPISSGDNLVVDDDFFPRELVVHTSQNDIVNLFLPLNALNFDDNNSHETEGTDVSDNAILFFVEGERDQNGIIDSTGLYVLKNKVATKILDNGRDFVAPTDDSKNVYFAATDGLYAYNAEKNTAEKYGTVTDNIISIAKKEDDEALFILTEDKQLYKVTNDGNKKVKIAEVNDAVQIVADYTSSLYYVDSDKVAYVVNEDGVKKISGLPSNPSEVLLLRPVFIIEDGVPLVVDDKVYTIFANGTANFSEIELKTKPTAYSPEGTIVQYYAHDKKIYEYNLLAILMGEIMSELKSYISTEKEQITELATKKRNKLISRGH